MTALHSESVLNCLVGGVWVVEAMSVPVWFLICLSFTLKRRGGSGGGWYGLNITDKKRPGTRLPDGR